MTTMCAHCEKPSSHNVIPLSTALFTETNAKVEVEFEENFAEIFYFNFEVKKMA